MNEKGVAAIMAMWLLAVLAIIGTTFIFMMRLEPIIARTHRDDMKALYVAQAGIDHAVYILKQDVDEDADHLGEVWAKGLTDQVLLDEAGYSVGSYTVTITDESGKTNLNTALEDQLVNLRDIDSTIVGYITTYRSGANGPVETIDELMCVRDIGQTIFDNNKELITVYTTDSKTNINTAHYRVLRGLPDGGASGLTEAEARDIVDYRDTDTKLYDTPDNETPGEDNTEYYTDRAAGTGDNGYYATIAEIENANNIDNTEATSLASYIDVKSQGPFTVVSRAEIKDTSGKTIARKRLRVVVDRGAPGDESRIKYYREEAEE